MANSKKTNEIVDTIIENQARFVDGAVEITKNLTKQFPIINETLDKGHKIYKESLPKQKEIFENAISTIEKSTSEMNQKNDQTMNFFQTWFENQMNWAKTAFNQNNSFSTNPRDWFTHWQNWMNQTQQMWNQNPFAQMMGMNQLNQQTIDYLNVWSQFTKQYFEIMSQSYGEWAKSFQNMTAAESFKGMNNMQENLSKFFELWIPMFKSIQERTFSSEAFSQMMNAEKFKSFVDSFFRFMPEGSQKMVEQLNMQFVQMMKQIAESGLYNYDAFKNNLNQLQQINGNPFAHMMNMYTQWKAAFNQAVSPLTKLVNENESVKTARVWSDLSDKMVEFSIKHNELQYMIYQHALRVMDRLAVRVATKVKNGENIESVVKLYQEWLMIGDEVFTQLFQSDEYSKLMTEVSSLQMKIKNEIDLQMEKTFFAQLPIATRSEMNEVYKNLYDLRKMYRNLEKMFESKQPAAEKTAQKSSGGKKK